MLTTNVIAMPKKKKPNKPQPIPVAEPAKIRPTHVRDRTLSVAAGSPLGWRNSEWPIQRAYESGRLGEASESRWAAMEEYDAIFKTALERSGRDSTDMDIVSSGIGFPITEIMCDAIRMLISIDSHMPNKDRQIVRKLCEGWSLPGAVRHACGDDFADTTAARVRDALDALTEAIGKAKEGKFRYVSMKPS